MPLPPIPAGWADALGDEADAPYYGELSRFVDAERRAHEVFPPPDEVFAALERTPRAKVKALILGQDPYPRAGQAHGLAFSVRPGTAVPGSLRNVFKELASDVGVLKPPNGSLAAWADEGVLLLNAVLTVRAGEPNSHKGHGWETFTDAVIRSVSAKRRRVAFILWGAYAKKKLPLIDTERHTVITGAHPSPLARGVGFFDTRPFSRANAALAEAGVGEIDWALDGRA